MSVELKFGEEARDAYFAGATKLWRAVSSTLGARGRNVIRQKFGMPKITNDGVSVADAIELSDPFEKQGADLFKQGARATVKAVGDGTTTFVVAAYAILQFGLDLIKSGTNSTLLRKKVEIEGARVMEKLKEKAIQISSDEDLENIATISVESPEYGKIVADAVRVAGKDGLVLVEEDTIPGIRKEEVAGYRFDRGWENAYLVTDAEKMQAVLDNPFILVADKSWNLVPDLLPMFEEIKKAGFDKLLIIAEEISGDLMKFIVVNRLQLKFHAVVVKTPFDKRTLEDIAALTGATAITQDKGVATVSMRYLGKAAKVIVTETTTTIIDGGGDPTSKIEELRVQITDAEEGYEKIKLQERLAKLTGKTVILKVGAATEVEAKFLKDKIDDAVGATRAAVDEGVVAGGGMALFRLANELYADRSDPVNDLMYKVLTAPVDKILENSGVEDIESVKKELSQSETSGYNALTGEIVEDIVKAGILDPVKVTRSALENAFSLSPMLFTVDTSIAEIPEK